MNRQKDASTMVCTVREVKSRERHFKFSRKNRLMYKQIDIWANQLIFVALIDFFKTAKATTP